ncbi:MAG TPA: hypothetical protein VFP54_05935 [Acidimicrobiales bacterium]|nr:hypothetical protein [Acidimicrobiales bacterium]
MHDLRFHFDPQGAWSFATPDWRDWESMGAVPWQESVPPPLTKKFGVDVSDPTVVKAVNANARRIYESTFPDSQPLTRLDQPAQGSNSCLIVITDLTRSNATMNEAWGSLGRPSGMGDHRPRDAPVAGRHRNDASRR